MIKNIYSILPLILLLYRVLFCVLWLSLINLWFLLFRFHFSNSFIFLIVQKPVGGVSVLPVGKKDGKKEKTPEKEGKTKGEPAATNGNGKFWSVLIEKQNTSMIHGWNLFPRTQVPTQTALMTHHWTRLTTKKKLRHEGWVSIMISTLFFTIS